MHDIEYNELSSDKKEKINKIIKEYVPYKRDVYVYNYDNHLFIGKYESVKDAAKATNSMRSDVSSMINGRLKSVNGFIFSIQPITDFKPFERKTNAKKQDIYIYKDNKLMQKCNSIPEASRYTDLDRSIIERRTRCNSLLKTDGYVFSNHILDDEEIKMITDIPHAKKMKKIAQYTLDGEYIQTFNSISDAARQIVNKDHSSTIGAALNDRYKTAYGYRWEYI